MENGGKVRGGRLCFNLAHLPCVGSWSRIGLETAQRFSQGLQLSQGLCGSDVPSPGPVPPKLRFCSERASLRALSGSGCVADALHGMSSISVVFEGFSPAVGSRDPWVQLWQLSRPHCAREGGLPLEANTMGHHGAGKRRSELCR